MDLVSPDNSSDVDFSTVAHLNSTDPSQLLSELARGLSSGQNALYSNFQAASPKASQLQTNPAGMTGFAAETFQGTVSTNQGTQQKYGLIFVAVNPQADVAIDGIYEAASPTAAQTDSNDVDQMLNSILNS